MAAPTRLVARNQHLVSRKVLMDDRDQTVIQATYACMVNATPATENLEPGDTLPEDSSYIILTSQNVKGAGSAEELIQVTARKLRAWA